MARPSLAFNSGLFMRKGKRFSPRLIRKWLAEGRGTGQKERYQGWHLVSRSDPSSRGASVWLLANDCMRLADLLSVGEELVHALAPFCPGFSDAQENFPLSREHHDGEAARLLGADRGSYRGTLEIAQSLGFKHPYVRKDGDKESWVMSTDNLITTSVSGRMQLTAVSVKNIDHLSGRARELALIEKTYWNEQGVEWLLITPTLYPEGVREALRSFLPFAISSPRFSAQELSSAASMVEQKPHVTLTQALRQIEQGFGCTQHKAQILFWQAVFSGLIPLDLREARWASNPLKLLDERAFWAQNPVACRRSSWTY